MASILFAWYPSESVATTSPSYDRLENESYTRAYQKELAAATCPPSPNCPAGECFDVTAIKARLAKLRLGDQIAGLELTDLEWIVLRDPEFWERRSDLQRRIERKKAGQPAYTPRWT